MIGLVSDLLLLMYYDKYNCFTYIYAVKNMIVKNPCMVSVQIKTRKTVC